MSVTITSTYRGSTFLNMYIKYLLCGTLIYNRYIYTDASNKDISCQLISFFFHMGCIAEDTIKVIYLF